MGREGLKKEELLHVNDVYLLYRDDSTAASPDYRTRRGREGNISVQV
jgi:hypothetical protein